MPVKDSTDNRKDREVEERTNAKRQNNSMNLLHLEAEAHANPKILSLDLQGAKSRGRLRRTGETFKKIRSRSSLSHAYIRNSSR
jgi:hypothetical protein